MEKSKPDQDDIEQDFASIVENFSVVKLSGEDRNQLQARIKSAAEYLSTTTATPQEIEAAREMLWRFLQSLVDYNPRFSVSDWRPPVDHEVFMNGVTRWLPCPPFCK